ncbi:putative methionine-tRNA ligase-like protein, partial [Trifolium pratense]
VLKWVAFAESLPVALDQCFENLKKLNDELSGKSVLVGNGLKPSEADVIVFSAIHSSLDVFGCLLPDQPSRYKQGKVATCVAMGGLHPGIVGLQPLKRAYTRSCSHSRDCIALPLKSANYSEYVAAGL